MYVCICNGITDKQIRAAVASGVGSVQELREELGVGSQCGSCVDFALSLIQDDQPSVAFDETLFAPA